MLGTNLATHVGSAEVMVCDVNGGRSVSEAVGTDGR